MVDTSVQKKTRSFLAILLPDAVKKAIHQVSSPFRKLPLDVKWVEERNYHLTLKFFGSLTASEIQRVHDTLKQLTPDVEQFSLSYGGFGVFPNLMRPRVVWLGLAGEVERLIQLYTKIEEKLFTAGFPREEKKFRPHLTLGRFRSNANIDLFIKFVNENPLPDHIGNINVDELHLMESRLTPGGPHYTSLAAYPLRKKSSARE
ncbi:MAG TPA: RNA 2',3'-cyclic phosphodiesterase [Syntrophomonadaceae bacterium]|nr:RNA 2',3'-cyclic phosphodiesterase [Syntrophomonadaceae bacterium]